MTEVPVSDSYPGQILWPVMVFLMDTHAHTCARAHTLHPFSLHARPVSALRVHFLSS